MRHQQNIKIGGQGMGQGRGMNPGQGSQSKPGQGDTEPRKGDLQPANLDTEESVDAIDEAFNGKSPRAKTRHHPPGEDPALPVDPEAEYASLATDDEGMSKVARLRQEAHTETPGRDAEDKSGKFPAIANDKEGCKKPRK